MVVPFRPRRRARLGVLKLALAALLALAAVAEAFAAASLIEPDLAPPAAARR